MNEIKITLAEDNLHIIINCEDRQYLEDLKSTFSFFVPGHRFMPRFLNSGWDGKMCLLRGSNMLPYGLFMDFIKWHKRAYKTITLKADDEVKALFIGRKLKPKYNLKYKPRPYQKDCVETILDIKKAIVKVATASGKSLIIAYIIKTLIEKYKNKQYLIIVPTTNLVEQFYGDLIEYGIDSDIIGRVYADIKEPDKTIVISTWQSLMNNHDWLDRFYSVVVDEVHIAGGGVELKKILSKLNCKYRIGVTATLPNNSLELANVKSYLGPVVKNYSAKELSDDGYISRCCIRAYNIHHQQGYDGEYHIIREKVFSNPARLKFIKDTINDIGKDNILILVSLVEKEGELLAAYLEKTLPNKEIIFIYGDTKVKDREHHRQDFAIHHNKVVIATYPIFKLGINVPSLKYVMLASPLKSKISVLQSIGRVLRMHASKTDGAYVIDLIDHVPYLWSHGEKRIEYYKKEQFEIQEREVNLNEYILGQAWPGDK
jgi:superfamily II DNA or RNA helicase